MLFRFSHVLLFVSLILIGCLCCFAQAPDTGFGKPPDSKEETPKGIKETLDKMRIEKDKKDHDQMIERGEEVLKISEELEKNVDQNGHLTDKDYSKVAAVEKLVKKIRTELGGSDDDDAADDPAKEKDNSPLSPTEVVKSLHSTTSKLYDELKKTTRFTVSATAIQTSNSVLRLARFLNFSH